MTIDEILSLSRDFCVFYRPESLKLWIFISQELHMLEVPFFQARKSIKLEKYWW